MFIFSLAQKVISVVLTVFTFILSVFFPTPTPVEPEDFRITAYIVEYDIHENMDISHFEQVTDFIIFGIATFTENGEIKLTDNGEDKINLLKSEIDRYEGKRVYLSILGPGSQSTSSDWYEQMADQAQRHNNAFKSGKLENNIKSTLEKYDLDGIFFDYEYPIEKEYWKAYNDFIVSLDEVLTDKFKIGVAVATWDLGQNRKAKDATDIVAVMNYDLWDKKGNHATINHSIEDIVKCRFEGYDMAKLDLGLPFYARPTTQEGYWYAYKDYCNSIDENGLYIDSGNTGLTFSFNTADLIKEKTALAIKAKMGGVMVWHYGCDTPSGSGNSLFDAVQDAKDEAINNR